MPFADCFFDQLPEQLDQLPHQPAQPKNQQAHQHDIQKIGKQARFSSCKERLNLAGHSQRRQDPDNRVMDQVNHKGAGSSCGHKSIGTLDHCRAAIAFRMEKRKGHQQQAGCCYKAGGGKPVKNGRIFRTDSVLVKLDAAADQVDA